VELDEFHIGQAAAGSETGSHAVSSGYIGIGSIFI
jgi:hypothetical protein